MPDKSPPAALVGFISTKVQTAAPKVESAFVRCIPHASLPYIAKDEAIFAKVVLAAFGQRRKTLRNTLKGLVEDDGFTALNISSQLRAENLSVADFVTIANYLS